MSNLKYNFLFLLKTLFLILVFTSCSTLNFPLSLEKIFQDKTPLLQPKASRYATTQQLPGLPFKPDLNLKIEYSSNGDLQLIPGDYLIPVMTYCMSSEGTSPEGHTYLLSKMKGIRTPIIKELNLKALPMFSYQDVQILSWSLQNGLKYNELTSESKKIVDTILPQFKDSLKDSFLEVLTKKWNELADSSQGTHPKLSEASDDLLYSLGHLGKTISDAQKFQNRLKEMGNNYEGLRQSITIIKNQKIESQNTPWSKITESVYARFITNGHYQELGQIQIRVLDLPSLRQPNSKNSKTQIDLLSWIGDPNQPGVQPLSFSPIYGFGGVLVIPAIIESPLLAAAVLGAVLAADIIDWKAFSKLSELLQNVKDKRVQEKIANGQQVLNEIHDKLEKPLKEKGIINKKTKRLTKEDDKTTRVYEMPGGQKALDEAYDKLDGQSKKTGNVDVKQTTENIKAVKRPATGEQVPTLELQPEKTGDRINDSTRVKLRYK